MLNRRKFLFRAFWAALWLLKPRIALSFPEGDAEASILAPGDIEERISFKDIDYFLGEKINYDISFLWFSKAATGSLKFEPEGGGFSATLYAETLGFIGFLTQYRKHIYISHMNYIPDKNKMRVTLFERFVNYGKREEKSYSILDYDKMTVHLTDYVKGKIKEDIVEPIPEGIEYEDILSAFYNFRLGFYGEIKRGRKFQIKTIPSEGKSTIDVHIKTHEESKKTGRIFGKDYNPDLMHVNVRVPEEIFKSKNGDVSVLFDEAIVPAFGVVQDYIGFGDVKGTLLKNVPQKEGS